MHNLIKKNLQQIKLLLSISILLFCQSTFSQGKNIDTTYFRDLLKSAKSLSETLPDSAIKIYNNIEINALENDNAKILTECFYYKGVVLYEMGQNEDAFEYFNKAHNLAVQNSNEYFIYSAKVYIGTLYLYFSNYKLATEYCLEALNYFEKVKNYDLMSSIYLKLTFTKYEQKDYDKMKEYVDLSLKYSYLSNNELNISKSLLNLSQYYAIKREYKKTINLLNKSLVIATKIDNRNFTPIIYLDFSEAYIELNMLDSAEFYLFKVIKNDANPYFISKAYLSYSNLYIKKNELDKAISAAENAEKISHKNNMLQNKGMAYEKIAEIYALKKLFHNAYAYKSLSSDIKDSIFTKDNIRFQNELESIYQNNKNQKEIERLSKEKLINDLKNERFQIIFYSVVLVFAGIVIIVLLFLRHNSLKSKQQAMELEQKLLRTQMNPHFIFNSISSIQHFILNNNPIDASAYLADFGKLMRTILTGSSQELIPLEEEIELVTNYLKLQHLRFNDKFEFEISVSGFDDIEDLMVPPMLTQPFIENAIIHGIMKKPGGRGLINLTYKMHGKALITEIQDNGIGRNRSRETKNKKHQSKAIDITAQRINIISKKYKQKISFEIIDLTDNKNNPTGTLIRFILPVN